MTDTSEEHLADLAKAMAALEKAAMQLIVDELAEALPALDHAEEEAAAALREACAALGKPRQLLAKLDEEIGQVTGKASEWKQKLSSLRAEDRVEARVRFQAWNDELDKLNEKRDQAERDLQPYFDARNKASGDLELVQGAKRGLIYAMLTPYESRVGQGTKAYVAYRQPRLAHVLLSGRRDHPEWEPAVVELEELNKIVQTPEQAWQAMTAQMSDEVGTPLEPVPSGREVLAMDAVKIGNESLPPSRIEDHRNTPPPPREYMQLPGRGVR